MQEFQVFDWTSIGNRIHSKRTFLYWFIPLTLCCVWGLTFSVPSYFVCSTSLTTEEMHPEEGFRTFTFNHPENYDLGVAPMAYSIVAKDYPEVVGSTEFICRILSTPVVTEDSSFSGTYYTYLATRYRYPWHKACSRFLHGKAQLAEGAPLPQLDAFYPRGAAADAICLAQKDICCDVDRHTSLITLSVKAQDALVAAMVTQAVADELKQFADNYFLSKTELVYQSLQEHIALTYADYEQAVRTGDSTRAAMLQDAYRSFQRQAIVLHAQMHHSRMFITLNNVTVPADKAGPHRLTTALLSTLIIVMLALLYICRRELFCSSSQAKA